MHRRFSLLLLSALFAGCAQQQPPLASPAVLPITETTAPAAPTAAAPAHRADPILVLAKFKGHDRRGPKTSIADGDTLTPASIGALLDELPLDEDMIDHEPPIEKTGEHAARVDEEEKNVKVKGWLYAFKMESDNDFHLIVGDAPTDPNRLYMNCEVSGLPAKSAHDYATLKQVRSDFLDLLEETPSASKYTILPQPIHIQLEGSLFYDIDHRPGVVGPTRFRSHLPSAWEIHPITSIKKLN